MYLLFCNIIYSEIQIQIVSEKKKKKRNEKFEENFYLQEITYFSVGKRSSLF